MTATVEHMYCDQCEQVAGGRACTRMGVCGKDPELAGLQDLVVHQLKGIGVLGSRALERGIEIPEDITAFVQEATFETLTNVDFDPDRFHRLLDEGDAAKERLRSLVGEDPGDHPAVTYRPPADPDERLADAMNVGILAEHDLDEDIRSLRQTLVYGMKGMAAYAHHARILGETDPGVDAFFYRGFDAAATSEDADELLGLLMELGETNLRCMEILDRGNTGTFGHPEPTSVPVTVKEGPFIVVSGHDLKDLADLLEQTEGKGVNVYTHGEMLPGLAYPELKKYPHLVGNFGGAWQDQQREFDGIPGAILVTTNCIQKPRDSYVDRIFTTGPAGWPGVEHIPEVDGNKDFSPAIEKALELGGWEEDEEEKRITVGFGHNAVMGVAGDVIEAVKAGDIRHFFLVGGCDGARPGRNYYTEFAEKAPEDTVILTLACGKFRFNKMDLGDIGGIPRLLDIGQCNDAYSAVKIAEALAGAFECDINELPLSMILSWYEQKAVVILLSLLALGVRNIKLGPSLPAFLSPGVLDTLVETFDIAPITEVDADLAEILG